MKRIATPMVGGVITSTLMELMVYPAIFYLWRSRHLGRLPDVDSAGAQSNLPATGQ
jgi:Cu(I)/Ag(I) efflux system membrane protein CusA/SilA